MAAAPALPLARHARRVRLYSWAALFVALFAVLVGLISANTHAAVLGWLFGITTAVLVRHRTRRAG
jgi:uncharacterized membrane protein YiaA